MRSPGGEACLLPAEVVLGPGQDWGVYWERESVGRGGPGQGREGGYICREGLPGKGRTGQPQTPVGRKTWREERGGSEVMMGRVCP